MPISGLVLTLSPSFPRRDALVEMLGERPELTVGEPTGPRLPVVTDTTTPMSALI